MTNALKGYLKLIVRLDRYKESDLPILVNEATTPSDLRASLTCKQSQTNQSDYRYIKLLFSESHHKLNATQS